MKKHDPFKIKFTDILYAAVISVLISQLTLKIDVKEGLLLFAFLIIFDDWVDYHISTNFVIQSAKKYFTGYIIDILTLFTWYFIATTLPNNIKVGLLLLAIFFLLALLWDIFMLKSGFKRIFKSSYLYLSIAYLTLWIIFPCIKLSGVQLLIIISIIYAILKIPKWTDLYQKASELFTNDSSLNI